MVSVRLSFVIPGGTTGNPEVFDGLEGVSVGGFTDDYFERALACRRGG